MQILGCQSCIITIKYYFLKQFPSNFIELKDCLVHSNLAISVGKLMMTPIALHAAERTLTLSSFAAKSSYNKEKRSVLF
jgi:hypothetical protein